MKPIRRCKRKITVDRTFERSNVEHQNFFNLILDGLEADFTLPDHRRDSILHELFTRDIYNKIVDVVPPIKVVDVFGLGKTSATLKSKSRSSITTEYSFKSTSNEVLTESTLSTSTPEKISIPSISTLYGFVPGPSTSTIKKPQASKRSSVEIKLMPEPTPEPTPEPEPKPKDEPKTKRKGKDVEEAKAKSTTKDTNRSVTDSCDSILVKLMNHKNKPKSTLYKTFFKKKPKDAAIWRKPTNALQPTSTAAEKADIVAEQIASNFVKWVRENGLHDSITVDDVMDMFSPAKDRNKLIVKKEEVFSIPGQVGWSLGLKERTAQFVLAGQIVKDKAAYQSIGEKNIAFGKSLPDYLYKGTSINDSYKKWLSTEIPYKSETMENVFSEIEDLFITKKYADFIAARPYIKPPEYLIQCGLIKRPDRKYAKKGPKGRRRLTRKETIYTLIEGPKVERLRYSNYQLPVMENEEY